MTLLSMESHLEQVRRGLVLHQGEIGGELKGPNMAPSISSFLCRSYISGVNEDGRVIASGGAGDWALVAYWESVPEKHDGLPGHICVGYAFPFLEVEIRG